MRRLASAALVTFAALAASLSAAAPAQAAPPDPNCSACLERALYPVTNAPYTLDRVLDNTYLVGAYTDIVLNPDCFDVTVLNQQIVGTC